MAAFKVLGVAVVLAALATLGVGAWQWHQETTGQKVTATVTKCHHVDNLDGGDTTCTGRWVEGGNSPGGTHVVTGTINGAGKSEVGGNITVRVHGSSAYTEAHTPAIVPFVFGLLLLTVCGMFVWAERTGRLHGGGAVSNRLAKTYTHVRR